MNKTIAMIIAVIQNAKVLLSTLPPQADREVELKIRREIETFQSVVDELSNLDERTLRRLDGGAVRRLAASFPRVYYRQDGRIEVPKEELPRMKWLQMGSKGQNMMDQSFLHDLDMTVQQSYENEAPALFIGYVGKSGHRDYAHTFRFGQKCDFCSALAGIPVMGHSPSECPCQHGRTVATVSGDPLSWGRDKSAYYISPGQCKAWLATIVKECVVTTDELKPQEEEE